MLETQKLPTRNMTQAAVRTCFRDAFLAQPIDYLLNTIGRLEKDIVDSTVWATKLQHKSFIYTSTLIACFRDSSLENRRLLDLTRQELMRFCDEDVGRDSPETARHLVMDIRQQMVILEELL